MSNLYYGNRNTFLQNNKCQIYIMVTATLSYKTTNIKFYIAEPKTPLDNQLQYKQPHS